MTRLGLKALGVALIAMVAGPALAQVGPAPGPAIPIPVIDGGWGGAGGTNVVGGTTVAFPQYVSPYSGAVTDSPAGTYYNVGPSIQYGASCSNLQWDVFTKAHSYLSMFDICGIVPSGASVHQFVGSNVYLENNGSTAGVIPIQGTCLITGTPTTCYGVAGVVSDRKIMGAGQGSVSGNTLTVSSTYAGQGGFGVGQRYGDSLGLGATVPVPWGTTILYDGTTTNTGCGGVQCTGTGAAGTYGLSASGTVTSATVSTYINTAGGNTLQMAEFDAIPGGANDRSRFLLDGSFTAPTGGNALGFTCTLFTSSLFPWDDCVTSGDGAATNAIVVGALWNGFQTLGAGSPGQYVQLNAWDNTYNTERYIDLQATAKYRALSGMDWWLHYPTTYGTFNVLLDTGAFYEGQGSQALNSTQWTTGTVYAAVSYVYNAGFVYETVSGGTAGATAPTCTSGTCSDGTITWTYVGPTNVVLISASGANNVNLGATNETVTSVSPFYIGASVGVSLSATGGEMNSDATYGLFQSGYGTTCEITFGNAVRTKSACVSAAAGAPFMILSTSTSSSTTTGSLQVAGGEGLAGALYAGGLVSAASFTSSSLAGTGSRVACVTSAGAIEAGTLSSGLVTCP